ncbi:MAG: hypothetical protein J7K89_04760 [Candidatus Cloacimonetes bacterium]|nr:hypothetical protein [Candidatus Cloacimonadota bacterium]
MNGLIDYFMQAELGMQIAIGVALLLVCLLLFKVLKKLFFVILILAVLFVGYTVYTRKSPEQSAQELLQKSKSAVETVKKQYQVQPE